MPQTAKLFLAGLGVTIIGMIHPSSTTDETKSPVPKVGPKQGQCRPSFVGRPWALLHPGFGFSRIPRSVCRHHSFF